MNTLFLQYLTEMQNKGRLKFHEDHSLSLVSTFGIGGRARVFVMPYDTETLTDTVRLASRCGRYIVIGNASNLLFDDRGFCGAVISTVKIRSIEALSRPRNVNENRVFEISGAESVIKAACGAMLPVLSAFAAKNSFTGFEGLCSIPATVGGALCLNAGAYGSEISDTLIAYEAFFPEKNENKLVFLDKNEFSYRKSPIGRCAEIVTHAYFSAKKGEESDICARIEKNKAYRTASQPIGARSAGSFFKRPCIADEAHPLYGKSAGELIDRCGLKGMSVGGAEVSQKHANFIINKSGDASAHDVLMLAENVKKTVFRRLRVRLKEEVEFVPRNGRPKRRGI